MEAHGAHGRARTQGHRRTALSYLHRPDQFIQVGKMSRLTAVQAPITPLFITVKSLLSPGVLGGIHL